MSLIAWGLRYRVDPSAREVSTDIAGMAYRKAIYREDLGCAVDFGGEPGDAMGQAADPASAKPGLAKPGSAGPAAASRTQPRPAAAVPATTDPRSNDPFPTLAAAGIVQTGDERLRRAIDDAFVEPDAGARRRTQAVVVVHRGRLLAERYAPDVDQDTPLPGHSISKSVTHALIGVLARQHRLDPDRPVPVPAWQAPDDPRAGVTPNHLLAMASGLRWDERHGGWDEATRHWFDEPDPTAYAVSVPAVARPNEQWGYSNLGYTVLSRLLRDAAGGHAADVLALAQRELFGPTGMRHAVMTFDSTGTPQGSNLFLASARDWARFGLLYLNDGLAGTAPDPAAGVGGRRPHAHAGRRLRQRLLAEPHRCAASAAGPLGHAGGARRRLLRARLPRTTVHRDRAEPGPGGRAAGHLVSAGRRHRHCRADGRRARRDPGRPAGTSKPGAPDSGESGSSGSRSGESRSGRPGAGRAVRPWRRPALTRLTS